MGYGGSSITKTLTRELAASRMASRAENVVIHRLCRKELERTDRICKLANLYADEIRTKHAIKHKITGQVGISVIN